MLVCSACTKHLIRRPDVPSYSLRPTRVVKHILSSIYLFQLQPDCCQAVGPTDGRISVRTEDGQTDDWGSESKGVDIKAAKKQA